MVFFCKNYVLTWEHKQRTLFFHTTLQKQMKWDAGPCKTFFLPGTDVRTQTENFVLAHKAARTHGDMFLFAGHFFFDRGIGEHKQRELSSFTQACKNKQSEMFVLENLLVFAQTDVRIQTERTLFLHKNVRDQTKWDVCPCKTFFLARIDVRTQREDKLPRINKWDVCLRKTFVLAHMDVRTERTLFLHTRLLVFPRLLILNVGLWDEPSVLSGHCVGWVSCLRCGQSKNTLFDGFLTQKMKPSFQTSVIYHHATFSYKSTFGSLLKVHFRK